MPYGCRSGSCGACKAKVLQGAFHYEDPNLHGLSKIDSAAGDVLLCQAHARSNMQIAVREIERAEDIEIKKMPCRVAELNQLSHDVMQLWLTLPINERLQFLPGQYIMFLLPDGRRRAFSLANAPQHDERLELHIRYVRDGDFTHFVFHELQQRDILRIEGPFGNFYLRHNNELPILLVAGGTGFAPIKAIIEHALAEGLQRPMQLYWGVQAKRDLYQLALVEQWLQTCPHLSFVPVLSEPLAEDDWQGRTGFVHETVLQDHPNLNGYEVYASGPPAMVAAAQAQFTSNGLPVEHFFSDPFDFAYDRPKKKLKSS
jgi:CDP-4-dehydro-6-deoxyglucose reductase